MVTSVRDCSLICRISASSAGVRHRALDERDVVRARQIGARRLGEMRDVHLSGQGQQLVLQVEDDELAAVAGRQLPHGERRPQCRLALIYSSLIAMSGSATV